MALKSPIFSQTLLVRTLMRNSDACNASKRSLTTIFSTNQPKDRITLEEALFRGKAEYVIPTSRHPVSKEIVQFPRTRACLL